MHHTDYSTNLRRTQHKKIKKLSLNHVRRTGDLRSVILAVLLVLVALFQMDPANAQSAKAHLGFGTLQFGLSEQSALEKTFSDQLFPDQPSSGQPLPEPPFPKQQLIAQAIKSSIKMIVDDDTLTLIVDQTFSNPTAIKRSGDYVFPIPLNAVVKSGILTIGGHSHCKPCPDKSAVIVKAANLGTPQAKPIAAQSNIKSNTKPTTQSATQSANGPNNICSEINKTIAWTALHSERSNNILRITMPLIDARQTLRVYLNIIIPGKLGHSTMSPLLPYSDDFSIKDNFSAEDFNSVSAAADAMTANL